MSPPNSNFEFQSLSLQNLNPATMGFFDLNIPYEESERNLSAKRKASLQTTRLKLATKSLELGYSGVAYNRTIKGVMSESDKCQITRFSLAAILKHAPPSLLSSLNFHRHLLTVPASSPFRQYTRLTVLARDKGDSTPLNSGNPILKSYDLVAVTPLSQFAFEQACQLNQVDIISIDFSNKLPFRLNKSMVQAAVKRGVYFEITYSYLLFDAQARTEMIPNAKLLVDWTQGKNLIISSGAPSVTELRGSYDAANLSSLFGLTMEKSKAAISKNCRYVIANAARKKHFFKNVIRVEKLPPGDEINFDDWLKWDPITSAEGDLTLDDIGKSFSASYNVSKAAKAIDFTSAVNGIPSHGLQIKDIIPSTVAVAEPFSVSKDLTTALVCKMPEQPLSFCSLRKMEPGLVSCDLSNFFSSKRNDVDAFSVKELENVQALDHKNVEPMRLQPLSCTASDERNVLLSNEAPMICPENTDVISSHDQCASAGKSLPVYGLSSSPSHCESKLGNSVRLDIFTQNGTVGSLAEANQDNFEGLHGIEAERVGRRGRELQLASCDEPLHDSCIEIERSSEARDASNQVEAKRVSRNDKELPPAFCEESFHDNYMGRKRFLEERDTSIVQIDGFPVEKSDDHIIIDNEQLICNEAPSTQSYGCSYERITDGEDITGRSDLSVADLDEPYVIDLSSNRKSENFYSVAHCESVEQDTVTSQMQNDGQARTNNNLQDNSPLGRGGVKRKTSQRISLFPFKRLINPRPLRKKARK